MYIYIHTRLYVYVCKRMYMYVRCIYGLGLQNVNCKGQKFATSVPTDKSLSLHSNLWMHSKEVTHNNLKRILSYSPRWRSQLSWMTNSTWSKQRSLTKSARVADRFDVEEDDAGQRSQTLNAEPSDAPNTALCLTTWFNPIFAPYATFTFRSSRKQGF